MLLFDLGADDELVTVEDYILKKCYTPDDDDLLHPDFITAIDGGGWQGWHCEGSFIRSLFGLLLYDIIFYDVKDENVFITPYQDSPLDLAYSSFYDSRSAYECMMLILSWCSIFFLS